MISIIIPTYNEAANISKLVKYLLDSSANYDIEVIICDAGSSDDTVNLARAAGAIVIISDLKGRAAQMNLGASRAKGSIFYFIHADSIPPKTFCNDILGAAASGYSLGRYRTKFNSNRIILAVNAFFTRFDWFVCYGGDQTLFITKMIFDKIGGFNSDMLIMEDYDIVKRARKIAKYKIFDDAAIVSARKYETNSWYVVQQANRTIVSMYKKGASQQEMVSRYKQMLVYR